MQTLLDLLQDLAGESLGSARIERDPLRMLDKQTGKMRSMPPERKSRRKHRSR